MPFGGTGHDTSTCRHQIAIRDSKAPQGAALLIAPSSFAVIVEGVRSGQLGS
ncbi:DUF397 domain-containing protein [Streptomyces yangpuensis]|uniref:DUF397 domain-containing protein n=1 Tax=Streptomyces yangpuensis TaxID=1648182 RepID=A0ABY5Q492_9ACTN|nr:DUF397 domain-containing protein [Streptomyces yangpuensis]UUY50478.1 DUF397 domain-containing protein [Streptomyces yangpuensis]